MITVSRSVLKRFRTLCRRGGLHKYRAAGGFVATLVGGPDGCRMNAASPDLAIEYRQPGPCEAETIRLPFDALQVCEGRDDGLVTIEVRPGNRVLFSWTDRGVPRQHEVDQPKAGGFNFPDLPTSFVENEAGLWKALRDAVATTDAGSTRYALGCLHLRGKLGRIDATDGRQVLTQSGYQFGFDDDLLVPASAILGCRDLDLGQSVAVWRNDEWVGLGIGHTSVMVRIQKDARFPRVDDLIPVPERAPSQLELSTHDARFLLGVLPSLPSNDPQHMPLTCDLNGQVLIRSRDAERAQPTEVELTSSRLSGEPVLLNTDRRFVERALRLGFRTASIYGCKSPILCADDRRRFLWALLDSESAVPKSTDAVRIESSMSTTALRVRRPRRKSTTEVPPLPEIPPTEVAAERNDDTKEVEPMEGAMQLRDALRNATSAAHHLVRQLKRQKRRSRMVEATLSSLRSLPTLAG